MLNEISHSPYIPVEFTKYTNPLSVTSELILLLLSKSGAKLEKEVPVLIEKKLFIPLALPAAMYLPFGETEIVCIHLSYDGDDDDKLVVVHVSPKSPDLIIVAKGTPVVTAAWNFPDEFMDTAKTTLSEVVLTNVFP